mmetsp:Transcript_62969/g.178911  ORF Transcript_62969/g.178911 Transcript_62969/m.178911 type:complete len:220 (-) Transcript_62969:171-830(-)
MLQRPHARRVEQVRDIEVLVYVAAPLLPAPGARGYRLLAPGRVAPRACDHPAVLHHLHLRVAALALRSPGLAVLAAVIPELIQALLVRVCLGLNRRHGGPTSGLCAVEGAAGVQKDDIRLVLETDLRLLWVGRGSHGEGLAVLGQLVLVCVPLLRQGLPVGAGPEGRRLRVEVEPFVLQRLRLQEAQDEVQLAGNVDIGLGLRFGGLDEFRSASCCQNL